MLNSIKKLKIFEIQGKNFNPILYRELHTNTNKLGVAKAPQT